MHTQPPSTQSANVFSRLGIAGGIVLGEYVSTTLLVDQETLPFEGPVAWALSWAAAAAPLVIVVAAAALLFARKRLAQLPIEHRLSMVAWLPHAAALAVYVAATYGAFALHNYVAMGLWLVAVAAVPTTALLAVLPWQVLRSLLRPLAPAIAIAAAAWVAGLAAQELWPLLARATLGVVVELAYRTWNDVLYVPDQMLVGTYRFHVTIAPMCSGLEGLGLMAVLLGAYLWWRRTQLRWPVAWVVLPIALTLVWFGNALRIFVLIAIGTHVSPELALGAFHSKAGWVFFCLVAIAMTLWLERSSFWLKEALPSSVQYENPVAAYVVPLLCLMGVALVSGSLAQDVDWAYGVRLIAAGAALAYFRRELAPLAARNAWSLGAVGWGAAVGAIAFALWWLFTAPSWLPEFAFLTARPSAEENAALGASLLPLSSPASLAWISVRVIGAVLFVPVVEELGFRGFLLRRVIRSDFDHVPLTELNWIAVAVSSLLFGLLHGAWLAGTACGVLYAWVQQRTGTLTAPIVAHAVTNALLAGYVLASGQWWQWL